MNQRSVLRAFSAAVATVVISSGLLLGAVNTAQAAPEPPPPSSAAADAAVLPLLGDLLTQNPVLQGTGAIGAPLTAVEPVFGLLSPLLQPLVTTDVTWLCDGVPIPGIGNVTSFVPTEAESGCQVAAQIVSSLLGFVPLTLVTNLIDIPGGEEPELPTSLADVLTTEPLLEGTGALGSPLTLVGPVFGLLPAELAGLVTTDVTWLCDGVPIPGVGNVTSFVPTAAQAGCDVAVGTVSKLLGVLPLDLLTNVVGVDETVPDPVELAAATDPRIIGDRRVGGQLQINPGSWLGGTSVVSPLFDYQWYNTDGAIPGATKAQYVPHLSDAGRPLAATVTARLAPFLDGMAVTNVVRVQKLASKTRLKMLKGNRLRIRLTPAAVAPTGKVRLKEGRKVLRTIRVRAADNGSRVVRVPRLRKGTHRLRAVYTGNQALQVSRSNPVRIRVR